PQRMEVRTSCTSCAAAATSSCPHSFSRAGTTNCSGFMYNLGVFVLYLNIYILSCPSWSGKTCSFHGVCLDGDLGNGTCVCDDGFSGFACHKCKNQNAFGEKCDKECECVHGVCNNGPEGDGQCLCQPPYIGKRCDQVGTRCSNCSPYSYCKGEGDTADCECLPGYMKMPNGRCGAFCSGRDCDINAQCSLQGSKVVCACKPDYQGDGKICVPINPCSENNGGCPINSTICVFKGPNKSSCECMFGMSPIGGRPEFGCQLVSACSADTCDPTAVCQTELDGQPRCVCEAGQIGDGRRCYGNLMERLLELDRSGSQRENLTGAVALFARGCSLLLSHSGPFTAFIPLLKTPLTVGHLSGVDDELVCKNHLILGQHLYKDLEGRDFNLYGGAKLRTKGNKRFILMDDPSRLFTILEDDLPAANGIIHIINQPIINTLSEVSSPTIENSLKAQNTRLTVNVPSSNCGSPPPLRGPGPLTVFVPTNQAVDRARDGSILYMLNDAKHKLQELLRHHVFTQAVVRHPHPTLPPTMHQSGEILLGERGIHLVSTNIMASNGIIHMIDGLLYPPSILPILPHRCDIIETEITVGPCVHCSYLHNTECPDGSTEMIGCEYVVSPLHPTLSKGCAKNCANTTKKCCKGFYGPDCKPCIGGFQHPCYDKGTCFDGIHGNGSCSCKSGFKGVACHICSDPSKHGDNCDEECRCVHGVCDNRPGSGGLCRRGSCIEGYTGENCDNTAMPCNSDGLQQHCHIHAYCTHTGLHTVCVCRDGYEGDGHSCSPINPCLKSNRGGCHTNAECVYVGPGNVSCVCAGGWTGDGKMCVEINNCLLESPRPCSPNADCYYVGPGSSRCECKKGYMGNGIVCDLINPCLTNNGGCHDLAKCELKEADTHTCTCPDGYMGNGVTCYGSLLDVNIQTSLEVTSLCVCLFVCLSGFGQVLAPSISDLPTEPPTLMAFLNTTNNFTLFRQYALMYNLSENLGVLDFTILLPTDDAIRQHLSRTNSSLLESDVFNYHVVPNELLFPDRLGDVMLKSTLLGRDYQVQFHLNNNNQTVVNDVPLDGSFIETQYGVIMVLPQVLKVRHNRCSKQVFLQKNGRCSDCDGPPRCLLNYAPIKKRFPANMVPNCRYRKRVGSRRKSVQGCVIKCLQPTMDQSCCPGYYGHECFKCPGDVGSWCSNHGECQDGNHGNGECHCYEGFHGTACEDCEPGRYGVNCTCVCDHGKCEDGLAGSGRCVCYKGWKGASCSVEIKDDACGGVCDENANCITGPQGSAAACVCVAGYEGNGTYCNELDLCSRSNGGCSGFATCMKVSAGQRTCTCLKGYTGDGVVCLEVDGCLVNNGGCHPSANCFRTGPNTVRHNLKNYFVCEQNNGGCSRHARCEYIGDGQRNCTCYRDYVGDGIDCRGNTNNVSHMTSDLTLTSDLPLLYPSPHSQKLSVLQEISRLPENAFFHQMLSIKDWKSFGRLPDLIRYHIVSCEILTLSDLKTTERVVSTSGHMLYFSLQQGSVWLNNRSRIVKSDYTTTNGVIHHIDTLLMPYKLEDKPRLLPSTMNFTTAAVFYGYSRFYKLVEDAGLLPLLQMPIHQPFTMFWPTDDALNSLPAERQHWLSNPDHQEKLAAIVKAHIIRNWKGRGGWLDQFESFRTMHGSIIKYSCDKTLGAVLINDNAAKLVERYLTFTEGVAYGIDQLLEPPGLGAYCDGLENRTTYGRCGSCRFPPPCPLRHTDTVSKKTEHCLNYPYQRHGPGYPRWYDSLDDFSRIGCKRVCQFPSWVQKCCKNHYGRDCQVCPGGVEAPCGGIYGECDDGLRGSGRCRCHKDFRGVSCELCATGRYGPNCTACSCGKQGRCDQGIEGTGQCFCNPGWVGDRCSIPEECRQCHSQAVCVPVVGCQCKSGFQGNGTFCTPDLCSEYNGGCHQNADCNQTGLVVNCTCHSDYQGDGYSCEPINRCVEEVNGGCSDFASCKFTGPNERECECLPGYVGNGVQCLEKMVPPVDRCLEENGGCDPVATCKDLHYHANTAGVFHLRSPEGKYKMNFSQADAACQAEGATLVTFKQLGDAQQLGMHLCVAGWMAGGKVGYPTRFPSVRCGDNHVGLVIYKEPVDQSSKYDAYCYRLRDVSCVCPAGYVGNGDFCNGVLTSVLAANSNVSIFYKVSVNGLSSEGKQLVEFLTYRKSEVTLFVPHNSGFSKNQTLSGRDLEYHVSANHIRRPFKDLRHEEVIASRLGFNLTVAHGNNEVRNALICTTIFVRTLIDIIHPITLICVCHTFRLQSSNDASQGHAHSSGTAAAILVSLLLACVLAALGYYIFKHKTDAFRFHYFKNEDEDGVTGGRTKPTLVSIPNPLYSSSRAFAEPFGCHIHDLVAENSPTNALFPVFHRNI
uniref:Stabilin 1 n=1 Tax=Monopterus albus TaxID=43700 RepID=A0A3Q3KRR5_MONAL